MNPGIIKPWCVKNDICHTLYACKRFLVIQDFYELLFSSNLYLDQPSTNHYIFLELKPCFFFSLPVIKSIVIFTMYSEY